MSDYICNAIIESARIGLEPDHGCFLGAWLSLKYDGAGQGFGGFVLGGTPDAAAGKHFNQPNLAAEFIVNVLRVADVERWDQLPGKTIRVRKEDEWGAILAIGHIVKDLWFSPRETFKEWARTHPGLQKETANV